MKAILDHFDVLRPNLMLLIKPRNLMGFRRSRTYLLKQSKGPGRRRQRRRASRPVAALLHQLACLTAYPERHLPRHCPTSRAGRRMDESIRRTTPQWSPPHRHVLDNISSYRQKASNVPTVGGGRGRHAGRRSRFVASQRRLRRFASSDPTTVPVPALALKKKRASKLPCDARERPRVGHGSEWHGSSCPRLLCEPTTVQRFLYPELRSCCFVRSTARITAHGDRMQVEESFDYAA
jgi:hypothetical protein